jgi:hypothetical protein
LSRQALGRRLAYWRKVEVDIDLWIAFHHLLARRSTRFLSQV